MNATEQVQSFVQCLFADEDVVEWRAIGSGPVQRGWALARDLPALSDRFTDLNGRGYNIYLGINPRCRHGQTGDASVTACKVVFVDFDNLEGASFLDIVTDRIERVGLPAPTLLTFTGHGCHAFWRLTESVPPDTWRVAQERFIEALDTDRSIRNTERIMRLVGFLNIKDPNHPQDCFILDANPSRVFDLTELLASLPTSQIVTHDLPAAIHEHTGPDASPLARRARTMKYASRWESVPEGERNRAAFIHACQLTNDLQVAPEDAAEILRLWNTTNVPPLPDSEIAAVLKSAQQNAKLPPGCKADQPRRQAARGQIVQPVKQQATRCEPILQCLADVSPVAVDWLWHRRIPRKRITLLPGPPGVGKSFVSGYMTARVSTGSPWPDGAECPRGSVILICAEDDPADTLRPRLDSLHADVRQVHLLSMVRRIQPDGQHSDVMFSLADVDALETALKAHPDCLLIIIDPIGSFVGGRTDTHRDNEVRSVLAPVAALAQKYGPAVLVIAHHRKGRGDFADDLVLGSKAFSGLARAVWHITRDKQNRARRLFVPGKNNLAPEGTGLAFTIGGEPATISWEKEPVHMTADDALADAGDENAGVAGEAADWLCDLLADGRIRSTEVQALAKKEGISLSTLRRAKTRAKVVAVHDGIGSTSFWWWALPGRDQDDPR